ncbi:MAG: isoprenylcysteine carboxylmethyltransferase family protein [Gemmatimonadales bacterium]
MALREDFERTGTWLFRYRSWLPPLLLIPLILAAPPLEPGQRPGLRFPATTAGFALAALGLVVRALVIGHAPRGASGKNRALQVADSLSTTGLYSVCRHPLYFGNLLLWLGPAVAVGRWWAPVLVTAAWALFYRRIIFVEERFLASEFGNRWRAWAARTPALIPRPGRWQRADLSFSPRTVLRQEYYALVSTVTMFVITEAGTVFRQTGRPGLDRGWLALFGATIAVGAVLRTLQRHSRMLDVEGR